MSRSVSLRFEAGGRRDVQLLEVVGGDDRVLGLQGTSGVHLAEDFLAQGLGAVEVSRRRERQIRVGEMTGVSLHLEHLDLGSGLFETGLCGRCVVVM